MSNKHTTQQHGCTTVNTTRPKSKLRKRNNKHKSVALKMAIIEKRREEIRKLKSSDKPVAVASAPKAAPKAGKAATTTKKAPTKKPAAKKPTKAPKAA